MSTSSPQDPALATALASASAIDRPAELSMIVARARNGVIGRQGSLPWRIAEDLAFFKTTTMGCPILMGRKTFDSIGRPLPGRRNLIISRAAAWSAAGTERYGSVAEALAQCAGLRVFVIGGAEIFAQALPMADSAWITEIDADVTGDTLMPNLEAAQWVEAERSSPAVSAEGLPYCFVRYVRRKAG